ncbi:ComEA family DNA-binding protein [Kitasatospora sp. NPDC050463]|uniref:ComEA family DNA-binding protein n=1 Tax=Kitasatospora sp. NPDC050463 TaxID=3155786 RepID=UPI0033D42CB9
MTSMNIGAVKRQRVGETARLRLAVLLPAAEGASGATEPSATGPPTEPSLHGGSPFGDGPGAGLDGVAGDGPVDVAGDGPGDGPSGGVGGVATGGVPPDGLGSGGPDRARWRFGPSVMLDRRAAAGLIVLLLLAVGYGMQHFWLARPQSVAVPAVAVASAEPGEAAAGTPEVATGSALSAPGGADASTVVVIDIGGRVHVPGVHTLPSGSRVADALRVAGGPLPETETKGLNLARVLTDGEQILVGEPGRDPAAGAGGGAGGGAGSGPAGAGGPKQPVSLNHATLEQLDTLPGVGPTLAQRIIAFRASHGSFRSLDQIRQVSGIGDRTYAEIRPMLTL